MGRGPEELAPGLDQEPEQGSVQALEQGWEPVQEKGSALVLVLVLVLVLEPESAQVRRSRACRHQCLHRHRLPMQLPSRGKEVGSVWSAAS